MVHGCGSRHRKLSLPRGGGGILNCVLQAVSNPGGGYLLSSLVPMLLHVSEIIELELAS
jgi:hypothetical protein